MQEILMAPPAFWTIARLGPRSVVEWQSRFFWAPVAPPALTARPLQPLIKSHRPHIPCGYSSFDSGVSHHGIFERHYQAVGQRQGIWVCRGAGRNEYFFHQSACSGVSFDELREGEAVTFQTGQGPKGPRAENVHAQPRKCCQGLLPKGAGQSSALPSGHLLSGRLRGIARSAIAEQASTLDQLGDRRRCHCLPTGVARPNLRQHVARVDLQTLRVDGAGRTADAEEPARHFLARAIVWTHLGPIPPASLESSPLRPPGCSLERRKAGPMTSVVKLHFAVLACIVCVDPQRGSVAAQDGQAVDTKPLRQISMPVTGDWHSLGAADAPLTLVEFTDYECPLCHAFHVETFGTLKEKYIDTGQVRFVSRDQPLPEYHPHAMDAAHAARCAGDQGQSGRCATC